MSSKEQLRYQQLGSVFNHTSKRQERQLGNSVERLTSELQSMYGVKIVHESQWKLSDIVSRLELEYREVDFHYELSTSFMKPDGGILSIQSKSGRNYPILITEIKNQGTNDLRVSEGKRKQAKGNAIERLGKNVIGFRTALSTESIFPFVCFGDGCDFAPGSSILDRVSTISMFSSLNKTRVHNEGPLGSFNRGSFYFRELPWTEAEMYPIMKDIANRSIFYYFSKYGISNYQ